MFDEFDHGVGVINGGAGAPVADDPCRRLPARARTRRRMRVPARRIPGFWPACAVQRMAARLFWRASRSRKHPALDLSWSMVLILMCPQNAIVKSGSLRMIPGALVTHRIPAVSTMAK